VLHLHQLAGLVSTCWFAQHLVADSQVALVRTHQLSRCRNARAGNQGAEYGGLRDWQLDSVAVCMGQHDTQPLYDLGQSLLRGRHLYFVTQMRDEIHEQLAAEVGDVLHAFIGKVLDVARPQSHPLAQDLNAVHDRFVRAQHLLDDVCMAETAPLFAVGIARCSLVGQTACGREDTGQIAADEGQPLVAPQRRGPDNEQCPGS